MSLPSRLLIVVLVMLVAGVLATPSAATEPSGTVGFSVGSETWVGQPVSITVSGTSSQAGELAVYIFGGSSTCPSVKRKDEVILGDLAPPRSVSAGSYSQTYSVTPETAGTYTLCGYLYDPSNHDTIYAAGTGSFTAAVPREVVTGAPPGNAPASTELEPAPSPPPPPHMTGLTFTVRAHAGRTAARPGHTELLVRAKGGALVLIVLKRQSRRRETEFSYASSDELNVRWTCNHPGGVYHAARCACQMSGTAANEKPPATAKQNAKNVKNDHRGTKSR